ncbi:telomere-protecting terminal protein Tpg [Streptomyces sp. NPDC003720]|uniref:telomere-protecting terminal protein Tpg n=1 Tax=Streptomyces sp. NPDC003720 TaxID=3364684 RepID=UPI0036A90AC7
MKDQVRRPRPDLAQRMEREVADRRQPQVRARARRTAATSTGIVVDTRARFGYPAAPGSTDDARLRHLALAPASAAGRPPLRGAEAGAGEDRLRQITAEALGEDYFRGSGRRAHGLEVEFTDLRHVEFDL